jgi:hypothetical protein
MTKKVLFSFITCLLFLQVVSAQKEMDSLIMNFHLKFGKQNLELEKKYVSKNNDTLSIDVFKFYLSNIQIQYADKTTFDEANSYHLVDIENPNTLRIPICKTTDKTIESVFFAIGIDSITNVSGALAGDLDPTKGMYWAWQSGYINMKIEGKSSSCKTRKNEFQFHIGGYLKPNYAMRKVILSPAATVSNLDLSVNISELFSKIFLSKTNSIMIPGKKAMEIADFSTDMFKIE